MNEGMNAAGPSNDEYETPEWLYMALHHEFDFTMDGAARIDPKTVQVGKDRRPLKLTQGNALAPMFSTREVFSHWSSQRIYCNPPYSDIDPFVALACTGQPLLAVLLLPVRTDNDWFFRILSAERLGSCTIRFFRKRIKFCLNRKPADSPRFPSMLAIWR